MSLTKVSYSMIAGATINALDYGMSTTATAAQNKTALEAAIATIPSGGDIYIPTGVYNITGDIIVTTNAIQIRGDRSQFLYGVSSALGDFYGGTCLVFTSGTYGFHATNN